MRRISGDRRLKLLGVSSTQPSPLLPGALPIGTTLPGFALDVSFGILARGGPATIVALRRSG
ncbi:hypothetical protein FHP25_04500 [Vineibacter terrae]|uniref:Uncharacterized protein n=1 Tax=Vineibacter terrae TaxID=2586908 RepID=A0A5C8PTY0_9HYPH|nr:hypothetical protein [Vineibacter terrae]TXL80298.1 hypothetical protein FHP25_04500 [Vineibacter terrae]